MITILQRGPPGTNGEEAAGNVEKQEKDYAEWMNKGPGFGRGESAPVVRPDVEQ